MRVISMRDMPNNGISLIVSTERFKPNLFHLEQGESIFKSHSHDYDELILLSANKSRQIIENSTT